MSSQSPLTQPPARQISSTFSLIAIDTRQGWLGSAVASRYPAVGAVVPHLRRGVGAINTQHHHQVRLAEEALALMAVNTPPETALQMILAGDPAPQERQLILIDVQGRKAAHTGSDCQSPRHHRIGNTCVAAGNTITGPGVIDAMVEFMDRAVEQPFALRLIEALAAGEAAGGDNRGKQAAAIKIVQLAGVETLNNLLDFRVDDHPNPIEELRRICMLRIKDW